MSNVSTEERTRKMASYAGWRAFAAIILFTVGCFNVIDGLVSLLKEGYYAVSDNGLMVFNYTGWGWILLIGGGISILASLGVLAGQLWARTIGVVLAVLSAIAHLAFLAAFPLWSFLTIGMCVLLIYALTVPAPTNER